MEYELLHCELVRFTSKCRLYAFFEFLTFFLRKFILFVDLTYARVTIFFRGKESNLFARVTSYVFNRTFFEESYNSIEII